MTMSPTLRSSAPSSASTNSISTTSASPRTTPRKVHRCTKCGKPKAGHPRTGCPFAEDRRTQEPELADALSSLDLVSQVDDKTALRAGRASTARLGEDQRQQYPGMMMMRDVYSPDGQAYESSQGRSQMVHWEEETQPALVHDQHMQRYLHHSYHHPLQRQPLQCQPTFVANPGSARRPDTRARSVMPGTLLTPGSSFFGSPAGSPPPEAYSQTHTQPHSQLHSQNYSSPVAPQPLARSLSSQERSDFLSGLMRVGGAPPAAVFAISMSEIYQIQHAAVKVNFFSRLLPNAEGGEHGLLILGSDEKAVQQLFERVGAGGVAQPSTQGKNAGGGTLSAVAGGAVIGAVATFTGLAFS